MKIKMKGDMKVRHLQKRGRR